MNIVIFIFGAGLLLCGLFTTAQSDDGKDGVVDDKDVEPPKPPEPGIHDIDNATLAPSCNLTGDFKSATGMSAFINKKRWPEFYVRPHKDNTQEEIGLIHTAMWYLHQAIPCIKFGVVKQNAPFYSNYVQVIKGTNNGCSAYPGLKGGRQEMNLQSGYCYSVEIIMHELMHALGVSHEHERPDRDNYVDIHLENVQSGQKYNFGKLPPNSVTSYGVPYDLRSIMHYQSTVFSSNGKPTITAKNGGPVGSTGMLTDSDKLKLKIMYKCK